MNYDKWLEWNVYIRRCENKMCVALYEKIQYKGATDYIGEMVDKVEFKIWPWMNELSVSRKLNRIQEKILKRYAKYYKKWDTLQIKVLPGYDGGKIVLKDIKTYEFIDQAIKQSKKLKVIK